jgi:hypothetical protein
VTITNHFREALKKLLLQSAKGLDEEEVGKKKKKKKKKLKCNKKYLN